MTTVPFDALKLFGLKTRLPPGATSTLTKPAELAGADGALFEAELVVVLPPAGPGAGP